MKFLKSFRNIEESLHPDMDKKSIDDYIEYLSTMPEGEEKEKKKEELGMSMFGQSWIPEDDKKINDPNWDDYVWDGDDYKYKPKHVSKYSSSDFAISTSGDSGWGFGGSSRSNRKRNIKDRNRLANETPTFEEYTHPFGHSYHSNFEEDKRKLFSDDEYNQLVDDINKEQEREKLKKKYYDSGYIVSSLDDYMHSYKPSKEDYKPRKKTRDDLANSTPTFESKQEILLELSEYLQEFFDKYQIYQGNIFTGEDDVLLKHIRPEALDSDDFTPWDEINNMYDETGHIYWGMDKNSIIIDNIPQIFSTIHNAESLDDINDNYIKFKMLKELNNIKSHIEKRLDCDIDITERDDLSIQISLKNYHPLDDPNY